MSVLGTLAPRSFFFIGAATPELYTLSLHDALPISSRRPAGTLRTLCLSSGRRGRNEKRRSKRHTVGPWVIAGQRDRKSTRLNSSHMSISYAVFCLKKKNKVSNPNGDVRSHMPDSAD